MSFPPSTTTPFPATGVGGEPNKSSVLQQLSSTSVNSDFDNQRLNYNAAAIYPDSVNNVSLVNTASIPRQSGSNAFYAPSAPSFPQTPLSFPNIQCFSSQTYSQTPVYPMANNSHQPVSGSGQGVAQLDQQAPLHFSQNVSTAFSNEAPKLPLSSSYGYPVVFSQGIAHTQPSNVAESASRSQIMPQENPLHYQFGNPPSNAEFPNTLKDTSGQYQTLPQQTAVYNQSISQLSNMQPSNLFPDASKQHQTMPYQTQMYNNSVNQPSNLQPQNFTADTSKQYQALPQQTPVYNHSGYQFATTQPQNVTSETSNQHPIFSHPNLAHNQSDIHVSNYSAESSKSPQQLPPQIPFYNQLGQQPLSVAAEASKPHQMLRQQTPTYHQSGNRPPRPSAPLNPPQVPPSALSKLPKTQPQLRGTQGEPQNLRNRDLNFNNLSTSVRVPGKKLTSSEWALLTNPIDLLADYNFLPSDGPVMPPKPPISSEVNCDPDLMRCTLTAVPATSKLLSQCRLPLGLLMHPFRDVSELPVIQTSVIVRCRSCRTYINPFVRFLDSGRRWRCPVCTLSNTVPDEFFYDPGTQSYGDPSRRPEIQSATVEFIAPSEYMLRPPQAATYLFCFEVSRTAVVTGYLDLVCNLLAEQLSELPGDTRRQVAFLTYDSGLHFYVLSGNRMQMIICQDLSEVFLPDVEGMLNRINDNVGTLTSFLKQLPNEFSDTFDTGNCLGFVLQTALKLIGSSGGRVTIFNASLPSDGPGSLQFREEKEDLTQPNIKHLGPATDFYKTLALDFAAAQTTVDLFLLNSRYCDIATISGIARHSAGSLFHYPAFHYSKPEKESAKASGMKPQNRNFVEVENLRRDFLRYLTRRIGFEAVLRIRCTRGLNIQNFFGSFFVRSVDLLSLPNVNPDAGYAMQLEITDSLEEFPTVVLQAALLYTSSSGDRRIRVHTLCLPVTDSPAALFNFSDQSAIACLVTKMAVERSINAGIVNAREALCTVISDILSTYQKENNATSGGFQRASQCPPALRLLPAFICGALRFRAFGIHTPLSLDVRSAALELLINAPSPQIETLIYPNLYDLRPLLGAAKCEETLTLAQKAAVLSLKDSPSNEATDSSDDEESSEMNIMEPLNLKAESIVRDGIYLLDTGCVLLLLVGYGISSESLMSLIGLSSVDEISADETALDLPALPDGVLTPKPRRRLENLIQFLRRERPLGTSLVLLRHDAPEFLKSQFIASLVEDRTESAPSYYEFLQMIYRLSHS